MRPKRLSGPTQLTGVAVTQYTVAAARRALIRQIHVSNGSGVAVNFTGSIGADASATRFADAKPVPANDFIDLYLYLTIEAAEFIQAFGSTTGVLVVEIMGEEELI